MPEFRYDIAGQPAHIVVGDELAPFYRADRRYVEVVTVGDVSVDGRVVTVDELHAEAERAELEAQAAELTGAQLDAAVKAAKIAHPSTLSADEKRDALVEQQLAGTDDADPDVDIKES